MNIVHLTSVVEFMRLLLPDIQEVITDIEKDGGYLNFADKLTALLTRDGLRPWSSFYEKPQSINGLVARSLFDKVELAELESMLQALPPEKASELRRDIQQNAVDSLRELDVDQALSVTEDQATAMWLSMGSEGQKQAEIQLYMMLYSMMTLIHNYFALLTYGRRIWDLVEDAKSGDDDAFLKAVRVDRTVLFGIPYFQKRLVRAQVGKDPDFHRKLANAIKAKPLGAKFSHKMLMFVFMVLEDEGLLYDLSQEQLMDVCEDLGVYGSAYGVEDSASLRKLLNKYKRRTRRQNQI
jgi:hypothetical protein